MSEASDGDLPEVVGLETSLVAGVAVVTMLNPPLGAVLGVFMPAAKKLVTIGAGAWVRRQERKAAELLEASGLDLQLLDDPAFQATLEDETTLLLSTLDAAIRDDEAGKSWAYGALFAAFNDGVVDAVERVMWLKFVKDCGAGDLQQIVHCAQMVAACDRIPHDDVLKEKLNGALTSAGLWEEEGRRHFDVAVFWSARLFDTSNKRVHSLLDEYGFYQTSNYLSKRVLYELLPVFAPAAYRVGVVQPLTDDAFVEYVVQFTRVRRSEAPGA